MLIVGTYTTVLKDNKSLRSYKTFEIKVFITFLLVDVKVRTRTNNLRIRIFEAQKLPNRIRKAAFLTYPLEVLIGETSG